MVFVALHDIERAAAAIKKVKNLHKPSTWIQLSTYR